MSKAAKSRNRQWGKPPWKVNFRSRTQAIPDHVDFAIVGGGFTGLSAAAWLATISKKSSVLLLESENLGNGASGRTGGMALSQTAAGDLPGLGDVLKGYREILGKLRVKADLHLPGVWEIARGNKSMEGQALCPLANSPIEWNDSGRVRAVGKVPGGTVDPGKTVSGLAHAAQRYGAKIIEHAEVHKIELRNSVRLFVRRQQNGRTREIIVSAKKVLLATNAGSLDLAGGAFDEREPAEPKLTFALATAPLTKKQIAALGMKSGRPFYTVDFPYLWGRRLRNGMIFGSGLAPAFAEPLRGAKHERSLNDAANRVWSGLENLDVRRGDAKDRLKSLEARVRRMHPALKSVRVTHRWGGPILITSGFRPVFRQHPESDNVIVAGGYSGHGVALSVYLGRWAAECMLGRRKLPRWRR